MREKIIQNIKPLSDIAGVDAEVERQARLVSKVATSLCRIDCLLRRREDAHDAVAQHAKRAADKIQIAGGKRLRPGGILGKNDLSRTRASEITTTEIYRAAEKSCEKHVARSVRGDRFTPRIRSGCRS